MLVSAALPPDCQNLSMYFTMFFSSQSAVAMPPVQMHECYRPCRSIEQGNQHSYFLNKWLTMPIVYARIQYPVIQVALCLSQPFSQSGE